MVRAFVVCTAAYALLASCGNDRGLDRPTDAGEIVADADEIPPDVSEATKNGTLPCDIQSIVVEHCDGCHGAELAGGAPIHLVSYADLLGQTISGKPVAPRSLERITAGQMPPDPLPRLSDTEVAAFSAWVAAGTPTGMCAPPPPGPFDGPPVCTSGTMWTRGNSGSQVMHPGLACIACHKTAGDDLRLDDAPQFVVAGTAFPTGHEPDNCDGAAGAKVEVTDANNKKYLLTTNAAGNFFSTARIVFPIHVALLFNGKRRAMAMSPPTGDCNSCHTQDGRNMAPGRITLP